MAELSIDPNPTPIIGIPKRPRVEHAAMSENSVVSINGWKTLLTRYGFATMVASALLYYFIQTQSVAIAKIIDNQSLAASAMQSLITGHEMQQRSIDSLVNITRIMCVNAGKDEAARTRCLQ